MPVASRGRLFRGNPLVNVVKTLSFCAPGGLIASDLAHAFKACLDKYPQQVKLLKSPAD